VATHRILLARSLAAAAVYALASSAHAADAPPATIDLAEQPAAGEHTARIIVSRFGRYAITAKSKQGVSIELVDRASGPSGSKGRSGLEDGRLDLFLDRGEYKLIIEGDAEAQGNAKVEIHPSRELNNPKPPLLVDGKIVGGDLGDFQQRSYWLDVHKKTTLMLEAAGRNLADLRLWRDGSWLVDASPESADVQPRSGRPLTVMRLFASVEPGLYLLSAYGGPARPWAEEDGGHPFYLRSGVPVLPEVTRRSFTVSPFGYDRYLVKGAGFFRIELPEAHPAWIQAGNFVDALPFFVGTRRDIQKNTVPPVAEIDLGPSPQTMREIVVGGDQGQPYLLQSFDPARFRAVDGYGPHWVATVCSGHPEDSIDATGILVGGLRTPVAFQAVPIDDAHGLERRFNLLDPASIHLEVRTAGAYRIALTGAEAEVQIQPFLIAPPSGYRPPDFKGSGSIWKLDRGIFVLSIRPRVKGILQLSLKPERSIVSSVLERDPSSALPRPSVQLGEIALPESSYWLYANDQPGVRCGIVARRVPIDPREPLPISQLPGEAISVRVTVAEEGLLGIDAPGGPGIEMSLDGHRWTRSERASLGEHVVSLRSARKQSAQYNLIFSPDRLEPSTPLPELSQERLSMLPHFPVLAPDAPAFFDLERTSEKSFLLRADRPALYRLESTGLLATSGALRTRTITALTREGQNGIGRNFLVQRYLGEGDYQVTVRTEGQTRGHLGVRLEKTSLLDGGALAVGVPARTSLPPGRAIAHSLEIGEDGEYDLTAVALGRVLKCRLEDEDGWPIVPPNTDARFRLRLRRGRYRLVILPESTDARVVALLDRVSTPIAFKGHGPHAIPLARRIEHTWIESGQGEARRPDRWSFTMPAHATAIIALGDKMYGNLIRTSDRAKIAQVKAPITGGGRTEDVGTAWRGALKRGEYELEVWRLTEDTQVPYAIEVGTDELVAGTDREVSAPSVIPVSIGADQLIEISSSGASDVRARLIDGDGRTIAVSDDRPDDWNFLIARRLSPGLYRLAIEPVGTHSTSTHVSVSARREIAERVLALPTHQRIQGGDAVHLFGLQIPRDAKLIRLSARSPETLGIALEVRPKSGPDRLGSRGGAALPTRDPKSDAWRTIDSAIGRDARIEAVIDPSAEHRLRFWSADRRNLSAEILVEAVRPRIVREEELARGLELPRQETAYLELALDRPGTLRIDTRHGAARFAEHDGEPLTASSRGLVSAVGDRIFVAVDGGDRTAAMRVRLAPQPISLELSPDRRQTLDLREQGIVVVEASSPADRPAIAFASTQGIDLAGMALHRRAAIALSLTGDRPVLVWSASRSPAPFEVKLRALHFGEPRSRRSGPGRIAGALAAGKCERVELGAGSKRIRLALDKGLIAATASKDAIDGAHWAEDSEETLETSATSLLLLNPLSVDAAYDVDVELVSGRSSPQAITESDAYEENEPVAGMAVLDVRSSLKDARLHVRGDLVETSFLGSDGLVDDGPDISLGGRSGRLIVRHEPGLVIAWIDSEASASNALFVEGPESTISASSPADVPLAGRTRTIVLSSRSPSLVHVRTHAPVVSRWRRAGAPDEIAIHPAGASLDLFLGPGEGRLTLRSASGGELFGLAQLSSTEITAIHEGLGPEVLLAPGSGRVFSFLLERASDVGIGVRASSDRVESTLLDRTGKPLGSGVVQMHALEAGTYYVHLRTPQSSPPVRARPAIAGLDVPPPDPPAEVVKAYLGTSP
jgi:hypothetical protein